MSQTAPDCPFCKIVTGDVPATVVRETERILAFRDVNPQAPVHVLVIPKAHYRDVAALADAPGTLVHEVLREAHGVAVDEGVAGSGYRLAVNTGPNGGQAVDHVHWHVLGGRAMSWPPG